MKKISICLAFCLYTDIFAAPVGNPAAPCLIEEGLAIPSSSYVNLRAGYEGDFVQDARLKQYDESHGRVDNFSQQTNSGTLTVNFVDRIDLYGVFGSSRAYTDWRFSVDDDTRRAEIETLYNFLWGAGARAILYKSESTVLGIGGRYEQVKYDDLWLTIDGQVQQFGGTSLDWKSFQLDLDVAYQIDIFSPYIGIKYSYIRTKIGNFDTPIADNSGGINRFKNRNPVGIFIGCSLSSGKYFMLNVEGRLIDEEAVTISGDFRF